MHIKIPLHGLLRTVMSSAFFISSKDITQKLAKLGEPSNINIVAKAVALFEHLDLAYSNAKKPEQRQLLRSACSNFSVSQKNVSIEPRKWVQVALKRENSSVHSLGIEPRFRVPQTLVLSIER